VSGFVFDIAALLVKLWQKFVFAGTVQTMI